MSRTPKRKSRSRSYSRRSRGRSYSRSRSRERSFSRGRGGFRRGRSRDTYIRQSTTIFIGNLSYNVRENQLYDIMEKYGRVRSVSIKKDRKTQKSKGYAFVNFYDRRDAEDAFYRFQNQSLDGRTVRLDWDLGIDNKIKLGMTRPSRYTNNRYRSRSRKRSRDSRSPRRSRTPKRPRIQQRRSRTPPRQVESPRRSRTPPRQVESPRSPNINGEKRGRSRERRNGENNENQVDQSDRIPGRD